MLRMPGNCMKKPATKGLGLRVEGKGLGHWGFDVEFLHLTPPERVSSIFRDSVLFKRSGPFGFV